MRELRPHDLGALEPPDLAGVSTELGARVAAKVERFLAPRDLPLAFAFIGRQGPLQRVFLCGASPLSFELIPLLEDLPGTHIAGVIDRRWEDIGEFQGYEVIGPDQILTRQFDRVLVAHDSFEPDMVQQLVAAGVPRELIVTVFTNPAYAHHARQVLGQTLRATLPDHVEHVILEGDRGGVFHASSLLDHLPRHNTVVLHVSTHPPPSLFYHTCETKQSLGVVIDLLQHIQPRVIYVRSQFTNHFLAFLARHAVPGARIIHEIHDFALLTPCDALLALVCGTEHELRTMRLAELDSLAHSDAVLSKYQGPLFDHVRDITGSRYFFVYPWLLDQPEPAVAGPVPPVASTIRIVYAGQLYPPGSPKTLEKEWNFLPLFLHLARSGRFTVDAFNSVHSLDTSNERYVAYSEAAETCHGFTYHRALSYRQAVTRMAGFDYGFMYNDDPRHDNLCRTEAVAARMTGYLSAGLPLVLDDGFTMMTGLVREFGAGVVLPRRDIDGLVPALINAYEHQAAQRDGARRLHGHMTANNRRVLDALWSDGV